MKYGCIAGFTWGDSISSRFGALKDDSIQSTVWSSTKTHIAHENCLYLEFTGKQMNDMMSFHKKPLQTVYIRSLLSYRGFGWIVCHCSILTLPEESIYIAFWFCFGLQKCAWIILRGAWLDISNKEIHQICSMMFF